MNVEPEGLLDTTVPGKAVNAPPALRKRPDGFAVAASED
jgi:hypothetical protein